MVVLCRCPTVVYRLCRLLVLLHPLAARALSSINQWSSKIYAHQHQPASVTIKKMPLRWHMTICSEFLGLQCFGSQRSVHSIWPHSNSDHSIRFTAASQQFGSQCSLHGSLTTIRITAFAWQQPRSNSDHSIRLVIDGYEAIAVLRWLVIDGCEAMADLQWPVIDGCEAMAILRWLVTDGWAPLAA